MTSGSTGSKSILISALVAADITRTGGPISCISSSGGGCG